MSTWSTLPLENRTVNLDRRRVPITGKDRVAGEYPYYGASGIVDHVDGFLFDGVHLLVAEDGENLRSRKTPIAFLAEGKFWVNNHAHVLQASDGNDLRFLAYALEGTDVSAYITGSTQPKLSQGSLNRIPICAPHYDEQRVIADTLGSLDSKAESNKRAVRIILDLVDAIAVREGADLPGVPLSAIASPARNSVSPTALGTTAVDHYSLPAFDESGVPDTCAASSILSNKLLVPHKAVLVSRLNPRFNRTWWASSRSTVPALASTEFLVLEAPTTVELAAVWLAVRDPYFVSELRRRVTGTSGSHQRVRPDDALAITVPDFSKAPTAILDTTLALLDRSASLLAEVQHLRQLRDALAPELLSGRLSVVDVERITA